MAIKTKLRTRGR